MTGHCCKVFQSTTEQWRKLTHSTQNWSNKSSSRDLVLCRCRWTYQPTKQCVLAFVSHRKTRLFLLFLNLQTGDRTCTPFPVNDSTPPNQEIDGRGCSRRKHRYTFSRAWNSQNFIYGLQNDFASNNPSVSNWERLCRSNALLLNHKYGK